MRLLAGVLSFLALLESSRGAPQLPDRWIWGQRTYGQPPVAERRSAFIEPISNGNQRFRSGSARSYFPLSPISSQDQSANFIELLKEKDEQTRPTGANVHVIAPVNSNSNTFSSDAKNNAPPRNLVTPGDFPYPFGAKPINLGDGTSIGWIPHDTLPVNAPNTAQSGEERFNKPAKDKEDDGIDERYTTLDKLQRAPVRLPDPHTIPKEFIQGLNPDEVFYADKDILIIKGGSYKSPEDILNAFHGNGKKPGSGIKNEPIGNELGEESNDYSSITQVRPAELFKNVPIPFRFVNGNVPTIVRPIPGQFVNLHGRSHNFRPQHETLFRPIPSNTRFQGAQSLKLENFVGPVTYQNKDNRESEVDPLQALPSRHSEAKVAAPSHAFKRSTEPKVVQYHYQYIGGSSKPIVNYQVHSNGAVTHSNANRNVIKNSADKPEKVSANRSPPSNLINHPTLPHVQGGVNQGATASFPPRPSQPTQGLTSSTKTQHQSTVSTTGTHQIPTRQTVISLENDTRVNFLPPLPRVEPQAERLAPSSHGGATHGPSKPRGAAPTIVRLHPQMTRVMGGGGAHQNNPSTVRRFMEPRRRVPLKQRDPNPRL